MKAYTEEETKYIVDVYVASRDKKATVDWLAEQLKVSKKSLIGKLSREKVYEKQVYLTKRGERPITKAEIVHQIAQQLMIDVLEIEFLVKAPKRDLLNLQAALGRTADATPSTSVQVGG